MVLNGLRSFAETNHPQTGDWLYDDPLELAKAIRKGLTCQIRWTNSGNSGWLDKL